VSLSRHQDQFLHAGGHDTLDVTATADRLSAKFVPANGYSFTDNFDIER
jgi:hypothetical protein